VEKNGEEEVIEEPNRDNDYINVQGLNDNERNYSDGGGDRGEVFASLFSEESDVDEDKEVVDTDEEVDNQPLILAELIEDERAAIITYANVNIVSDHTLNEEIIS